MSSQKTEIYLWSNNLLLEEIFCGQSPQDNVTFSKNKHGQKSPYCLLLVDLQEELSLVSQNIITFYKDCQEYHQKLVLVLIHSNQIDTEKNIYFAQLLDNLANNNPLHRLVLVKDLFQLNPNQPVTWLDRFISEVVANHKISISSKGKNYYYPISVHDVSCALLKVFFLSNTAGKTFWLVGEQISDLDLAYLVKKDLVDQEESAFEIEATGQNSTFDIDLCSLGNSSQAFLNWQLEGDFVFTIKDYLNKISQDKTVLLSQLHHTRSSGKSLSFKITSLNHKLWKLFDRHKKGTNVAINNAPTLLKRFFEYALFSIALIYFCVTLSFIGFTSWSLKLLETSVSHLQSGNIQESVQELKQSIIFNQIGEKSYSFLSPFVSLVLPDAHQKNYNLFTFQHYSQSSLQNLQQTYSLAEKVLFSIGDTPADFDYNSVSLALHSNLVQIYENLSQLQTLTRSGTLPLILEKRLESSQPFKDLPLLESQILQLTKTTDLIPSVFAGNSAKTIVVLFQNSHEVRSLGGSLDFFLVLSLERGRIVSHQIYQDTEMNNLSVGLVQAPPLIRLYSGSDDWKFRDMAYNPDFPQTATNISWFASRFLKFSPDIILAVNDRLIRDLLEQDKTVKINELPITSSDLDKDLSLNSNSHLYRQLVEFYFDKLSQQKLSLLTVGQVLSRQLADNQILFWTSDKQLESTILDQPYSGAVLSHICQPSLRFTNQCLSQTTYLNQSNFSLVPADYNLKRQITHQVWLESSQIRHEYLVDYHFDQTIPNLNRGLNQIIQLYAPLGAQLGQVILDGQSLPIKDLSSEPAGNLVRFQIPFAFSFNSDHRLSIQFSNSLDLPASMPFAYSLTEYRQAGLDGSNIKLQVNYPDNAKPASVTAPVTTGPNNFIYLFPPRTSTFGVNFVSR